MSSTLANASGAFSAPIFANAATDARRNTMLELRTPLDSSVFT